MGLPGPDTNAAAAIGTPRTRPGVFQRFKSIIGMKRKRPDDDDVDDGSDNVLPKHKLPRVDPELIPQSYNPIDRKRSKLQAHEDATRPRIIDAANRPADAEDVNNPRPRPAHLPDESLRIESNMPLGPVPGRPESPPLWGGP